MKNGWEIKELGDLITFERGITYSKGDEVNLSSIGVLRSNNVDLATHRLNLDEIKYLREDFDVPVKKKVKKSSLLMCMSNGSKDHLGKVAIIEKDLNYAFGGFMGLLTPKEDIINPKYLYYALTSPSFKDYIHHLSDGANINNLKYGDLAKYTILLPSLSKQQEIVNLLDFELAKVESLRLTIERSLENASDLFKASLKKKLEPQTGWKKNTLAEIVKVINGRAYSKEELLSEGKYRVLRVGNFFTNDSWYYSNLELDDDKYCNNGDLLYAWSASFGPKIWDGEKVIYHYHIWKMVPSKAIDKLFLFFWLQSNQLSSQVMGKLHGTTMVHITKGIMEASCLYYPSLEEQRNIAGILDSMYEKCKTLQDNYLRTLALCDDLKQSLLRKAFNGDL